MFLARNIASEIEWRRMLSVLANNLTALIDLLLGFPLGAATIRTTIAGSVLIAVASLHFAIRRVRSRLRATGVKPLRSLVNDPNLLGFAPARSKNQI